MTQLGTPVSRLEKEKNKFQQELYEAISHVENSTKEKVRHRASTAGMGTPMGRYATQPHHQP